MENINTEGFFLVSFCSLCKQVYFSPFVGEKSSVSDSHLFHADPDSDPAQNLDEDPDSDPDPGCQSNAAPCGSGCGSRPLCNKALVLLVMNN